MKKQPGTEDRELGMEYILTLTLLVQSLAMGFLAIYLTLPRYHSIPRTCGCVQKSRVSQLATSE